MKNIVLLLTFFLTSFVFAQSKNVQIEILKIKNDSLLSVLSKERTSWGNKEIELTHRIDSLLLRMKNKTNQLNECIEKTNNCELHITELTVENDKNKTLNRF